MHIGTNSISRTFHQGQTLKKEYENKRSSFWREYAWTMNNI